MARPIVQLAERLLERQPGIEYWQQVLPSKALLNRSLTRSKFAEFLGKQKPSLVAFEPCATAHYWARAAERHRHEVRIIPAKAVALFRQGHKADSNDALAVAEAARCPIIKEAPIKTVEQQVLKAILRARDRLIQKCIARNHAPRRTAGCRISLSEQDRVERRSRLLTRM